MKVPGPPRVATAHYVKRLAWLLACVLFGIVIGIIGSSVSGSSVWYVAIPTVVAMGWLFFADPTECELPPHQRAKRSPEHEEEP